MMENNFNMDLTGGLDTSNLESDLDVYRAYDITDSSNRAAPSGDSGFSFNIGQIGTLATGLAGMWNAFQQNKLRKKAFKFQKGVTNRNIANQAITVNNQLGNQAKMQAQMFGNKVGTQDFRNYLAANQKRVDGSAI